MFFLFILVIITLSIITSKIRIQIVDLKFTSQKLDNRHMNKHYKFIITLCIFYNIPILKLKITEKDIKKIENNEKLKQKIKQQKKEITKKINKKSVKILKELKNIKLNIKDINLKIKLGTEDAALTAVIIPIISTVISMFLKNNITKFTNQIFSVQPVYINENIINISLDSVFEIEVLLIINTLIIINKKYNRCNKKVIKM